MGLLNFSFYTSILTELSGDIKYTLAFYLSIMAIFYGNIAGSNPWIMLAC
jgi:hypothetical protein